MNNRKFRKYALKDNTVFEPIVYDKSSFNLSNNMDIFATTVVLDDYDWMNYKLKAWLPTKAYGDIIIEFEYNGMTPCSMTIDNKKKKYIYEFSSEIFQKNIIKFLKNHIKTWKDRHAFRAWEDAVDFYNAVITHPKTESVDIETITREEALNRIAARREQKEQNKQ